MLKFVQRLNTKVFLGFVVITIAGFALYEQFGDPTVTPIEQSDKEMEIMDCSEGINEEFTGTITRIERYDDSDFMHKNFFALEIRTNDSTNQFRMYQFSLRYDYDLLDFVTPEQRIEKLRGQNSFVLSTTQGRQKSFTIPDCGFVTVSY
jgi:hypothetical protein